MKTNGVKKKHEDGKKVFYFVDFIFRLSFFLA
jgi:hypothetical protein